MVRKLRRLWARRRARKFWAGQKDFESCIMQACDQILVDREDLLQWYWQMENKAMKDNW